MLKLYPHTMPPHCFIDPTHSPDAVKHIPDVSTPLACKSVSFKVKDTHWPSCTHHVLPHHSITSATHSLPVLRSIGPIFRSINASHNVSPETPRDRESNHRNIISEPTKLSVPVTAPLIATTNSSPYISPISSPIEVKP